MRCIKENDAQVRARCDACGAEQALRRFTSTPLSGRLRLEPEPGRWIQCRECGDWSPFEVRARPVSLSAAR